MDHIIVPLTYILGIIRPCLNAVTVSFSIQTVSVISGTRSLALYFINFIWYGFILIHYTYGGLIVLLVNLLLSLSRFICLCFLVLILFPITRHMPRLLRYYGFVVFLDWVVEVVGDGMGVSVVVQLERLGNVMLFRWTAFLVWKLFLAVNCG